MIFGAMRILGYGEFYGGERGGKTEAGKWFGIVGVRHAGEMDTFIDPNLLRRLRVGSLAAHLDAYLKPIQQEGFLPTSAPKQMYAIARFSKWISDRSLDVRQLDEAVIKRFLERNVAYAWTSDSTAVLFVSNRNGTWKLFRQAIDQVMPEVLVEGRSIFLSRLSPDGNEILYLTSHNSSGPAQPPGVMQVPLQGGSPRVVLQMPSMGNIQCARSPSKLCLFHTREGSTARSFSFNPEVGTTQEFTAFHVLEGTDWSLSPDGSQLALILSRLERKVTFMSVDDKSTREVDLNPWGPLGGIDWAADNKSLFVTSQTAKGEPVILGVEPNGNHRVLLEGDSATQYWWVIPSPDGRDGALEAVTGKNNVWMIENF